MSRYIALYSELEREIVSDVTSLRNVRLKELVAVKLIPRSRIAPGNHESRIRSFLSIDVHQFDFEDSQKQDSSSANLRVFFEPLLLFFFFFSLRRESSLEKRARGINKWCGCKYDVHV